MTALAPSTIAMSAYNILTMAPVPVTISQLYVIVCRRHETTIHPDLYSSAIDGLIARRWIHGEIVCGQEPMVSCKDLQGRLVRWRDRTGDGWSGWMVEDRQRGQVRLEEVIQ